MAQLYVPKSVASMAYGTGRSPSDGPSAPALVTAVRWIEAVMLGPVATAVAVIAVASVGYLMLVGRIDLRRGATIVLGCFILFGAPTIAAGLRGLAEDTGLSAAPPVSSISTAPAPMPTSVSPTPHPYDPYAGAAVPVR